MATFVYKNNSEWIGGHKGHIKMENGVELDFSAPPALHGHPDVLTPEDAFLAAVNTCYFMMFIWAAERYKIDLVSFECEAIGKVTEFMDKTSIFKEVVLKLKIAAKNTTAEKINSIIKPARKYSLVAESIKAEVKIEPEIKII
ncbi:MAG: OsmC family protein [Actinobacteria bacterium]|nr:OsmC family protein [Actinomycetota bacterium]MCL6086954.1 OsmC family protein [Actinomycetota bacterium]